MLISSLLLLYLIVHLAEGFRIGAFNVRTFGQKKATDTDIITSLAQIVTRYDIIAIQEIRDASGEVIPILINHVNSISPVPYAYVISDKVGRSKTYKEQYSFLYRNDGTLSIGKPPPHLFDENGLDPFEREPYLAKFISKSTKIRDFVLGVIHIKPDDAVKETESLQEVFKQAKNTFNCENVIIMGDYNADCSYFPRKAWPNVALRGNAMYNWLIGDEVDTTVKQTTDCAYDRIVMVGDISGIVAGSAGVYYFDEDLKLTSDQALLISDHYPVEVELTTLAPPTKTERDVSAAADDAPNDHGDTSEGIVFDAVLAVITILGAAFISVIAFAVSCMF